MKVKTVMTIRLTILQLFLVSVFISCSKKEQENNFESFNDNNWDQISLEFDSSRMILPSFDDTLYVSSWKYKKGENDKNFSFEPSVPTITKFKMDSTTKNEIYKIAFKLITQPKVVEGIVSDHRGNISICIKSKNTEICTHYKSIMSLGRVSNEAARMEEIIFKIVNKK